MEIYTVIKLQSLHLLKNNSRSQIRTSFYFCRLNSQRQICDLLSWIPIKGMIIIQPRLKTQVTLLLVSRLLQDLNWWLRKEVGSQQRRNWSSRIKLNLEKNFSFHLFDRVFKKINLTRQLKFSEIRALLIMHSLWWPIAKTMILSEICSKVHLLNSIFEAQE